MEAVCQQIFHHEQVSLWIKNLNSCALPCSFIIQVCRDGFEVKVCGFDGLDLEAGESILDEKCYFTKCGEKFELISGYPPMQGQVCEPKRSKDNLGYQYQKPCVRF